MFITACTICGGIKEYLGKLGKLLHFRCENCGMMTSSEEELDNDENLDIIEP